MITSVLIALALAAAVSASEKYCARSGNCDTGLVKYYKEVGCRPVRSLRGCCSKFDCRAAFSRKDPNKCYVSGWAYNVNAIVADEHIDHKCTGGCRCRKQGKRAGLQCMTNECSELFQEHPPPGCIRLYSHDQCCSTGMQCADDTEPDTENTFTCAYRGKNYIVGERFYPDEKPCLVCICQEEYDGTLREPWCQEVNCGTEVYSSSEISLGCAPIIYEKGCCPIDWRCPKKTDSVIRARRNVNSVTSPCVFGRLRLNVGDRLNSDKSCLQCKCKVPPVISCVQKGYC